jgi:hypothetical protein
MAQIAISVSVRLAWWAKPLAYLVAFSTWRFVGEKRALFYAGKAMCRGLRIKVK